MAIVLPLRAHTDARRPTIVRVKDANGTDLGLIHRHNGRWTNYPPDDASLKTLVPIGPFYTMEAAFEAFRRALGDAESPAPNRSAQST